jgi:uncharacterized protein (DUF427 family)
VEGRFYFPSASVRWEYLHDCGVKIKHNPIGAAVFFDIVVPAGAIKTRKNKKAAWSYRNLKSHWKVMEGYTAFWKGVVISAIDASPAELSNAHEAETQIAKDAMSTSSPSRKRRCDAHQQQH